MSQDSNAYITTSQSDSQEAAEPAEPVRITKRTKRISTPQKRQSLTNISKSYPEAPAPTSPPTTTTTTTAPLSSKMSYTQTTTTASYQENTSAPASTAATSQQQQRQQIRRTAAGTANPQRAPVDPRPAEQQQQSHGSVPRDLMEGFSASSYSWPILFAIVPPLGALVWGSAEIWGDFLLLILISYYLYNVIKVPWELYYAARSRRVINQYSAGVVPEKQVDSQTERRRHQAAAELRRQEFSSLLLVVASPFLAGYSLRWTKSYLSEYDRYMSNFNIVLFVFAASIRPFIHVVDLIQKRALYLQEQIHYPSTEVELLKRRVQILEQEINMLKKAFATKKDLGQVASGFAPTLSQFNRSLKRFEKKEQYLRTYSEERFDYIEAKMREFDHYVAYRIEQDQRTSPQRYVATLLFLPLNLTIKAIGIVAGLVPLPRGLLGGSRSPKPIGLPNGKEHHHHHSNKEHHAPVTKEAGELEKQYRQAMEAGGDEDRGSESEESVRR